jgi:hypothetical protein
VTCARKYVIGIDPAFRTVDKAAMVMMSPTGRLTSSPPQPQPMPLRGPRMAQSIREMLLREQDRDRGVDQRADFVRAFFKAIDREHTGIDLDFVVTDPKRVDYDLLHHWIFGPIGEFTGFARVNLMEDISAEMRRDWMVTNDLRRCLWQPRSRAYKHVSFYVTCIYHPAMHVSYRHQGWQGEAIFYVQFASYDDQAEWARLAAQDDYRTTREIG